MTLHVDPSGSVIYSIPASTRVYGSEAIASTTAGPHGEVIVTLRRNDGAPVLGGHVALAPTVGLPDGMFATVLAARKVNGVWHLILQRAAIDEVFAEVSVNVNHAVTPTVVNAQYARVPPGEPSGAARGMTISGSATFSKARAASLGSVFSCSVSGRPKDADSVLSSQTLLPISITLHDMHNIFRFDPGSLFPHRDPFLLMQVSGQADASVGFQAKAAFSCELSDAYRRSHRIRVPLGAIGPVPVTMYLEPTLSFEISESGAITLTQRHYFAITLKQDGYSPFSANLTHSADPVALTPSAALDASLFVGGDLSVMFGGGYGPANAQAGIYGAFGPNFEVAASSDIPGCVTASMKLEADLGVRLEFLDKRWSYQLASLTTSSKDLGGPWCVPTGGGTPSPSPSPPPSPPTPSQPPSPPTPSPPPISVPATGPTLVDQQDTAATTSDSDNTFNAWSAATGQRVDIQDSLPSSLSGYRCVVLDLNQSLASDDQAQLASYLSAGGTVIALGEHSAYSGSFDAANQTLNGLSAALGTGLLLDDTAVDPGDTITTNVASSPLTAGVSQIGYNWASSLTLAGAAQPLITSADGSYTLIGSSPVGGGTFVMSGDSNVFADSASAYGDDFYASADNGTLVNNLCP